MARAALPVGRRRLVVPALGAGWALGMVATIAGLDPVFDSESVLVQSASSVLVVCGSGRGASAAISGLALRSLIAAHRISPPQIG